MAKPNYNFEKRQRELKKNKKKAEKLEKKLNRNNTADAVPTDGSPDPAQQG
ncbi:MAG: hypothetical protein PHP86_18355 [Nevskiales bacterium]|nr:hypothetical protein [Nevskiales bacterium]